MFREGVIVAMDFFTALSGHTGVSHNHMGIAGNTDLHFMGRDGLLEDPQTATAVVGNARGIGAAHLAFRGQNGKNPGLLIAG